MNKKNEKVFILYIHNLSYDGFFILNALSKNEFTIESFIEKTSIYSISIHHADSIIVFKCSYKILPSSLKKIAQSFKLKEKLPFPYKVIKKNILFDKKYKITEASFNTPDEYLIYKRMLDSTFLNVKKYSILYCSRDVLITYQFIIFLRNMLWPLSIDLYKEFSAPSLALRIFIKKFNKNKVSFINKNIDNYLRSSYYGGRCEVYGNPLDNEFIYHYDFPGMYGLCMNEKFPFGKWKIEHGLKDFSKPGYYFIEYNSKMDIPILPIHHDKTNKLLFLNGCNLKGGFYFEEVINFIKNGGTVNKIIYGVVYENYDHVFKDYVDYFNTFREKGDEFKTFAKLMVNSLYGRMGMQNKETSTFIANIEQLTYLKKKKVNIISIKELNHLFLLEIEADSNIKKNMNISKNKIKNNVALAGAITAKARIKLYNAQMDVIKNNGRLLYSDTDSIFAAYKRNIYGEKHGSVSWEWENKDTVIKDAFFINPKSYGLLYPNHRETIKIKGLNQKNLRFAELKEKFYNNENLIVEKFHFLNKKDLIIKTNFIEKVYDLNYYDKRKFNKDKKKTEPINYNELYTL